MAANQTIPILQGKRDAETADANKSLAQLQHEHKEREQWVAVLLQREDLDMPLKPEEVGSWAKNLFDVADAIVQEGSKRNMRELLGELQRLKRPVEPALKLLAERYGITTEPVVQP